MRATVNVRPSKALRRASAIGLAPILLLASCGGDDEESSDTLAQIQATSYVVREPATTTTTIPLDSIPEGGTSPVEQQYTVVFGDAVYSIASKYGVDPTELANYNKWPEGINHPINVGDIVLIPPGAQVPGASSSTDDDESTDATAAEDDADSTDSSSTETSAAGLADNCKAGDYTIEAGDTPIGVARKFDVTVDQLNAANAATNGYGAFYVGLVIVIPEKDCE